MRYSAFSAAFLLSTLLSTAVQGQVSKTTVTPDLVGKYCVGCHNDKLKSGGFSTTAINWAHPDQNAAESEKVIRKLRSGMMPPAGLPRPPRAALDGFAASLESSIDAAALNIPIRGVPRCIVSTEPSMPTRFAICSI